MTPDDTALTAIESRVIGQLNSQVTTATNTINVAVANAIRDNPDTATGHELVSRNDVHTALTGALAASQEQSADTTSSGYKAATALALLAMWLLMRQHSDEQSKPAMPELGGMLAGILGDIVRAYGIALIGIQNRVRASYDTVSGAKATPARILVARAAVDKEMRLLANRLRAAGTVAVHQGYSDAQEALAAAYGLNHPQLSITKTWRTTSVVPCPSCKALNGTTLPLGQEFDRTATSEAKFKPPAVYGNLLGPPRHPRCRCRLVLDVAPAVDR